jgi:hypothetical protein
VTTPIASSAAIDPGDPSGGEPLSVSSNGATSGTGILWASGTVNLNTTPAPGILRAYDATNVGTELWDSYQDKNRDDFGLFAKFAAPTIANGKVYLATFSNQLAVYGLLTGSSGSVVTPPSPASGATGGAPTGLLSNLRGPTVTAESPASGATGVAVSTFVTATFSTPMNAATITGSTFTLAPSGGSPVAAIVIYSSNTNTAILMPFASLGIKATYTVTVVGGSGGVKDTSGNAMTGSVTWSLTSW